MDTVPANSVGVLDTLLVPVLVQDQHRPRGIGKIRSLPGRIVALLETAAFHNNFLGRCKASRQQEGPANKNQSFHRFIFFLCFPNSESEIPDGRSG